MKASIEGQIVFKGEIKSARDWDRLNEALIFFRGACGDGIQDIETFFTKAEFTDGPDD